jgi:hypothetical protein
MPKEIAMIELTEEQRHELSMPEPVVMDPQTRETYVLVRSATYQRMKALFLTDDYDPDEGMAYINEVLAEVTRACKESCVRNLDWV